MKKEIIRRMRLLNLANWFIVVTYISHWSKFNFSFTHICGICLLQGGFIGLFICGVLCYAYKLYKINNQ